MYHMMPSGNIYKVDEITSVTKGNKTDEYPNLKDRIIIRIKDYAVCENFESEKERDEALLDLWDDMNTRKIV